MKIRWFNIVRVTLVCVPVIIFAVFFIHLVRKKAPGRQVPSFVRWLLAALPPLFAVCATFDAASVFLMLLLKLAVFVSLFCVVAGAFPVLKPMAAALMTVLNAAAVLMLFREFLNPASPVFTAAAFAPAVAVLWTEYRKIPKGERLYGRVPADVRWIAGAFAFTILTLPFLPVYSEAMAAVLLPLLVMTGFSCALSGNTRAVVPGIVAGAFAISCQWWLSGLGSLDMGMGLFLLVMLLIVPAIIFTLGLCVAAVGKRRTIPLPFFVRIPLGIASLAGLMWLMKILL